MGAGMMERTLRSYWPGLLFGLAILLTVPILWRVVLPTLSGANWGQHGDHLFLVMAHAIGGLAMLGFGSAALFIGWTRRGFAWHRTVGRCYLILGSVGALGAIGLASGRHTRRTASISPPARWRFSGWPLPSWRGAPCVTGGSTPTGNG